MPETLGRRPAAPRVAWDDLSARQPAYSRRPHPATWVGVGGSPESVVRAARFGLPLMLAIIAGRPEGFAPYVELYKERTGAARSAGAADRAAPARFRSGDVRRSARDPVALLHGAVRVGSARARLAATDLRAVPGRGRARLDVRLLPQFSSVGDGLTLDVRVECVEFPCSGHAFELVLAALYEVESGTRHEIANGACH
jgi:hypothetical protein